MNEPTMNKLEQGLDRLERENRRLKCIGALVLVGIAAVVLMGQAKSSKVAKVIEAESFVVRDNSGTMRTELGPRTLKFFDENGQERSSFNDSGLYFYGGKRNFTFNVLSLGGLGATILLKNGGDTLMMRPNYISLGAAKGPLMILTSEDLRVVHNGKSYIELIADTSRGSSLNLMDQKGKTRAVLGSTSLETTRTGTVTKKAEPSLVLFDKEGKVLWSAP
ncbi:MAG: hypothetical protein ACE5I0_11010 [Candidatus Binatia bacterium]